MAAQAGPGGPPDEQAAFNWREVQPIVGIIRRTRTPQANQSQDMLENAVDYCADCGDEIPAGDYLCRDCERSSRSR